MKREGLRVRWSASRPSSSAVNQSVMEKDGWGATAPDEITHRDVGHKMVTGGAEQVKVSKQLMTWHRSGIREMT